MISKDIKDLITAFNTLELTQQYLSNLERLKEDCSITGEQYESMRDEYSQRLSSIESKIKGIKRDVVQKLDEETQRLGSIKKEMDTLATRYKVGELSARDYRGAEHRLIRKRAKLEATISAFESLTEAESSADIVGAATPSGHSPAESTSAGVPGWTWKPWKPWGRLIAPLAGIAMIVSVFLTWASAQESVSGFDYSWVIMAGITCGSVSLLIAFFGSKLRGTLHIVVALLALAAFGAAFVPDLVDIYRSAGEGISVTIREGAYIYVVAAIIIIIGGALDFEAK